MDKYWRWQGQMPFRLSREVQEILMQQGSTGETSPANAKDAHFEKILAIYTAIGKIKESARGKAQGSFTQTMREEMYSRLKSSVYPNSTSPVVEFMYKISRHKVIHVRGRNPLLHHHGAKGRGSKGFVLYLRVVSINGRTPIAKQMSFSWNRISNASWEEESDKGE